MRLESTYDIGASTLTENLVNGVPEDKIVKIQQEVDKVLIVVGKQ